MVILARDGDFQDLVGQQFGVLNVISFHSKNRQGTFWNVKCNVCGFEKVIRSQDLKRIVKNGTAGCRHTAVVKTGDFYGEWLVVEEAEPYEEPATKHLRRQWLCRCSCGTESIVYERNLVSGKSTKCKKCAVDELKENWIQDISGERFGRLVAIKRINQDSDSPYMRRMWLCKCDCGKECVVNMTLLQAGKTQSCGCIGRSKLECWFEDYFDALQVEYKQQIKFNDLTGVGNKYLSYDFGIYCKDNLICLIECQGLQHFKPIEYFGGKKQFEIQQMHDELKREYAFEILHVPLIEIPYGVSEKEIENMLLPNGMIWEFVDCYNNKV